MREEARGKHDESLRGCWDERALGAVRTERQAPRLRQDAEARLPARACAAPDKSGKCFPIRSDDRGETRRR